MRSVMPWLCHLPNFTDFYLGHSSNNAHIEHLQERWEILLFLTSWLSAFYKVTRNTGFFASTYY